MIRRDSWWFLSKEGGFLFDNVNHLFSSHDARPLCRCTHVREREKERGEIVGKERERER